MCTPLLSVSTIHVLQHVWNNVSCLIAHTKKMSAGCILLLPVSKWIQCKLSILCYKCVSGGAAIPNLSTGLRSIQLEQPATLCWPETYTLFFQHGFWVFFVLFFFFQNFFLTCHSGFFFLISVHTYAYEYLYACTLNGRSRSGDFRNTLLLLTRSHSKIVTIIIIEFVKCISWCWCCTFKSTSELTVNHTRNLRVRKNHDKNKCILTPQISVSAWMKNCH